ncbi:MAG TPA: tol-pal system protein YbgF, partial [Verrucomicrobiota bacterium]|nr:tol-pal system protein YbgF [Verrucomicrobiota bacterium]
AAVLAICGCATSSDIRGLRAELNQRMDEKVAAVDARMEARAAKLLEEHKESAAELAAIRKSHANTSADFTEIRDQLQQLRGQIETLKKETAAGAPKDDELKARIEALAMKINFIENFLEIGKKETSNDANESATARDQGKSDKAGAYAAAYQTFKNGNYAKAREAFQEFLTTYPSGEYADNAQYWIGECYFFEKQFEKAILEYEKVTRKFPSSNKVPYALVKQALSFQNLGDKASAKLLLQQVIKEYPDTSQARVARSKLQELR